MQKQAGLFDETTPALAAPEPARQPRLCAGCDQLVNAQGKMGERGFRRCRLDKPWTYRGGTARCDYGLTE